MTKSSPEHGGFCAVIDLTAVRFLDTTGETSMEVGERIILKREDGRYDVLEIIAIRANFATLDEAKTTAREGRGEPWYRDCRDAPGHLEHLQ